MSELFSEKVKKYLLVHARWAMSNYLFPGLPAPRLNIELPQGQFGLFIRLYRNGEIRGESGCIISNQDLLDSLNHNIIEALSKHSEPKIELAELPAIVIELEIVFDLQTVCASTPVHLITALKPQEHGLLLETENRSIHFLPSMWQEFKESNHFINAIVQQGGWDTNLWPVNFKAQRFSSLIFKEDYTKPIRS